MTFIVRISRQKKYVKFTRRAMGHFVTLIESGTHLVNVHFWT